MSIFNYDALIKRAEKLIKRHEDKEKQATIHIINFSDQIDNLAGLVVIRHPDSPP